jgi:predicted nucleic acid-binding protein
VIVVADTSVLLNLGYIGQLELLRSLFQTVLIPTEVAHEFRRAVAKLDRFGNLVLPAWIREQSPSHISIRLSSTSGLDPGERNAIALALEISADAILVDERRGHEVAVAFGLKAVGVIGILLQAKKSGLITSVRSLLDQLQLEAQFWMSSGLRARVLELAGE